MSSSRASFSGFQPLTANYIYCPNQFFDVCLPNCSRGAMRIVAYILRETLGWLDKQGNPLCEHIAVSYRDLIEKAGVSRGAIGPALKEACDAGFIVCQRQGVASSTGTSWQTATYSLRWDTRPQYEKQLSRFAGFYTGEGHRTPVPNEFFDTIVRNERLAVIKVVGTVIRHTVGYQTQFGGRRMSAPLSYRYIAQYAQLSHGKVLSEAIRESEAAGFISRVEKGSFSHDANRRQAAQYAIKWLKRTGLEQTSSKSPPVNQFKKPISIGSEIPSENQFKNPTTKKDSCKDTHKQQGAVSKAVANLTAQGFDRRTASALAKKKGLDVIERQINWIDARNIRDSRVGMLRKAIDEDWPMPESIAQAERQHRQRERERVNEARQSEEDAIVSATKKARANRKRRLLKEWNSASQTEREQWIRDAAKRESSKTISDMVRRQSWQSSTPRVQVLEVIARERNLPSVALYEQST